MSPSTAPPLCSLTRTARIVPLTWPQTVTFCAMMLPSTCAPSLIWRSEARTSPSIRPKTCAGPLHSMLPTIDMSEPMQEAIPAFVVGFDFAQLWWCEADEGVDLFAAHLPEFWQQGDEREGQHRADAWHRGQQLIALSESHIGGNHLGQALVEEADIGLQSHLAAFAEPPQHGIFEMSRLVLGRNMLVTQLSPHGHDL